MSIARVTDSGASAHDDDRPSITMPGIAVAGVLAAGVFAFIRRRERISGSKREEIPDALREDVGLPRRHLDARGWWEWR